MRGWIASSASLDDSGIAGPAGFGGPCAWAAWISFLDSGAVHERDRVDREAAVVQRHPRRDEADLRQVVRVDGDDEELRPDRLDAA